MNNNDVHSITTPHFGIVLKDGNDTDLCKGAEDVIKKIRPTWKPENLKFEIFTDGLTNKVLSCREEGGTERVLIRVYGENTDLIIDRHGETFCMKFLSDNGLAPPLYCTFINGIAYGFVPGVVLNVETVREKHISVLIARRMAQIHALQWNNSEQNKKCCASMFLHIEKFLKSIPQKFSDTDKQKKFERDFITRDKILEEMAFLKVHFDKIDSPLVFCHNDLLLKNIIYDQEKNCVTFIDFEYAGVNYRSFDIANHFAEFAGTDDVDFSRVPDKSFQVWWLSQYLSFYHQFVNLDQPSKSDIDRLYYETKSFLMAPHFFWSIWAVVQARYSNINFDYLEYAVLRMNEYFRLKNELLAEN